MAENGKHLHAAENTIWNMEQVRQAKPWAEHLRCWRQGGRKETYEAGKHQTQTQRADAKTTGSNLILSGVKFIALTQNDRIRVERGPGSLHLCEAQALTPSGQRSKWTVGLRLTCLSRGNSPKLMLQNLYCEEDAIVDTLEQRAFQGI